MNYAMPILYVFRVPMHQCWLSRAAARKRKSYPFRPPFSSCDYYHNKNYIPLSTVRPVAQSLYVLYNGWTWALLNVSNKHQRGACGHSCSYTHSRGLTCAVPMISPIHTYSYMDKFCTNQTCVANIGSKCGSATNRAATANCVSCATCAAAAVKAMTPEVQATCLPQDTEL